MNLVWFDRLIELRIPVLAKEIHVLRAELDWGQKYLHMFSKPTLKKYERVFAPGCTVSGKHKAFSGAYVSKSGDYGIDGDSGAFTRFYGVVRTHWGLTRWECLFVGTGRLCLYQHNGTIWRCEKW